MPRLVQLCHMYTAIAQGHMECTDGNMAGLAGTLGAKLLGHGHWSEALNGESAGAAPLAPVTIWVTHAGR